MNPWTIAALALVVGLVPCAAVVARASPMERLIALELAGLVTALATMLLAEGFRRPSLYDLALALVLLSFASTLVFAHFLERWL